MSLAWRRKEASSVLEWNPENGTIEGWIGRRQRRQRRVDAMVVVVEEEEHERDWIEELSVGRR